MWMAVEYGHDLSCSLRGEQFFEDRIADSIEALPRLLRAEDEIRRREADDVAGDPGVVELVGAGENLRHDGADSDQAHRRPGRRRAVF